MPKLKVLYIGFSVIKQLQNLNIARIHCCSIINIVTRQTTPSFLIQFNCDRFKWCLTHSRILSSRIQGDPSFWLQALQLMAVTIQKVIWGYQIAFFSLKDVLKGYGVLSSLQRDQNDHSSTDDKSKDIFVDSKLCTLIKMWLKFVQCSVENHLALVDIVVRRWNRR